MNIKERVFKLDITNTITKDVLPATVFFVLFVLLLVNPLDNLGIKSFDRIMGNGLLNGIDIEKRMSHHYFYYLIIFPLTFALSYYLFSRLNKHFIKKNDPELTEAMDYINLISTAAFVPMFFLLINKYTRPIYSSENFNVILLILFIVVVCIFILLKNKIEIRFNTFKWIIISGFSFCFPLVILLGQERYYKKFIVVFLLLIILFTYLISKIKNDATISRIQVSLIPFMYGLALISLFLEATNILNQYNIIVYHKRMISLEIYYILGGISLCIYFITRKIKVKAFTWENWYYPALLLSMALISVQPNLQQTVSTDLFESANHGLAVYEFLEFGKLPIFETFDAHMLANSIWGILYGILNNDTFGAIFVPYKQYILPILILLFYKLIKEYYCSDFAFLFVLLMPLRFPVTYLDFGYLAVICLLFSLKHDTFLSYLVYWISLVIICIYRLDNGAAFSFATVLTLIIVYLVNGRKYSLKKNILAFLITISGCFVIYVSVCLTKGIPIIARLKEILALVDSNINWAYSSLGDPNKFGFFFCYILIPVSVLTVITIMGYYHKINKIKISNTRLIILLSLAIAYFFNLNRGLVRHSLAENRVDMLLFSSLLLLALALSLFVQYHKKAVFTTIFISLAVIAGLLTANTTIPGHSISNSFFRNISDVRLFNVHAAEKVQRVILANDFRQRFLSAGFFINTVMEEDETYLDFTNQSLLYALTEKEKPVYVNQSPGLLSGQYAQEQFIEQIDNKKDQAIFALMPANLKPSISVVLDGIPNAFRYYKVSEYISQNFRPLYIYGDYAIWVRKDQYEKILLRRELTTEPISQKVDLKRDSQKGITTVDAEIFYSEEGLLINSGESDPQIYGLFDSVNLSVYYGKLCKITIEYQTSADGLVQLFYTTDEGEDFNESKSIKLHSANNQDLFEFTIPITEYTKIRFDTINGSRMVIKDITIEGESPFALCDYDYGNPDLIHKYVLMQIPYIWGTYDSAKAYNNEILEGAIIKVGDNYKINQDKVDKQEGNYLLIKARANEAGLCTMIFGSEKDGTFNPKSTFSFDLLGDGNVNTYLTRISSDFYWYSGIIDSLTIEATIPFDIIDVQLLKGD